MKRIELIGPSGVGKTTLYDRIKEIPEFNRPYLTLKDAYKYGAIGKEVSVKAGPVWFYQKLLKVKILDHKAQGLGKYVLQGVQKNKTSRGSDKRSFNISYNLLLDSLKEKRNNRVLLQRIKKFTQKVEEYLMLDRSLPSNKIVLIDEGMNHYHPGILKSASKYSVEELKKDVVLNPAGLISCEQTAKVIYEQALKRKERGIATFTHEPMNRKELRNFIVRDLRRHKKKVKAFKKNGIPVLHVDTHEEPEKNFTKIDRFVQSLGIDQKLVRE